MLNCSHRDLERSNAYENYTHRRCETEILCYGTHQIGDLVRVLNSQGHPPKIHQGMVVKVVKVIPQALFYDLRLENGKYHRWLADFEIFPSSLLDLTHM